jgi:ATP-binding cassette subfamily B protein
MSSVLSSASWRSVVPDEWQAEVQARLQPDENASAWVLVDLNAALKFHKIALILTDRRILTANLSEKNWQSWSLAQGQRLRLTDHAGVGQLELSDAQGRLAVWRFTLGLQEAVFRWVAQFEAQQSHRAQSPDSVPADLQGRPLQAAHVFVCPVCQASLSEDDDECPVCSREDLNPPSTWTLLKLWRFAQPYKRSLLIGFLLTLASTAATLVPPYLTMPLMDEVLIPYQNGADIDPGLVSLYLLGLFASGLLAWGLGWAKTYILALVSERIGSDLRTTTYEHLLKLSLEYFVDDFDDRRHLVLHQPDFGAGDLVAAALHWLVDPCGARKTAHRL